METSPLGAHPESESSSLIQMCPPMGVAVQPGRLLLNPEPARQRVYVEWDPHARNKSPRWDSWFISVSSWRLRGCIIARTPSAALHHFFSPLYAQFQPPLHLPGVVRGPNRQSPIQCWALLHKNTLCGIFECLHQLFNSSSAPTIPLPNSSALLMSRVVVVRSIGRRAMPQAHAR